MIAKGKFEKALSDPANELQKRKLKRRTQN